MAESVMFISAALRLSCVMWNSGDSVPKAKRRVLNGVLWIIVPFVGSRIILITNRIAWVSVWVQLLAYHVGNNTRPPLL